MKPLAPAFNLLGEGPRFLQDLEPIQGGGNPPEMLFIDSARVITEEKNADLMVRRGRYPALPLPLAAMALYTLQAFAPQGGRGYFTSMRGGGPMVTLVKPAEEGLGRLVWANVPRGKPLRPDALDALPWMRPTETSKPVNKKFRITVPKSDSPSKPDPEVFFGQPRRLRLVAENDAVTLVRQKRHDTNYEERAWRHPLTPYYKNGNDLLPYHPKPGSFGYRNWRGVILQSERGMRPLTLEQYLRDIEGARCSLIVAGWAMKGAKPRDFLWSEQPVFPLSEEDEDRAAAAVEAAERAGSALDVCVRDSVGKDDVKSVDRQKKRVPKHAKRAGQRAQEAFFATTQGAFEEMLEAMSAGGSFAPTEWVNVLRGVALPIFDAEVMPGLADQRETRCREAIKARSKLIAAFVGRPPFGKKIFDPLGLETPTKQAQQRGHR